MKVNRVYTTANDKPCLIFFIQKRISESSQYLSPEVVVAVLKADRKLTSIPVMFILLRIWGTIQFFYSIAVSPHLCKVPPEYPHHIPVCAPWGVFVGFMVLGYLQVCVRQKYRNLLSSAQNSTVNIKVGTQDVFMCVCMWVCVGMCMVVYEGNHLISFHPCEALNIT